MFGLFSSASSGPDGLEAWCVAFAACTINFVLAGVQRLSAILYVQFIDTFQIDRRDASLPFSVRALLRNLLGPLIGLLGQKYGIRPFVVTGAIVVSLGAASCFYANDILWITLLWGGLGGLGAALATTLNQAVLGQHFKKHKSTAAGLALSGGCASSFIFPVLTEYLVFHYGLAGTFLFLSGIMMHVLPAALIMKKPSWLHSEWPAHKKVYAISNNSKRLSNHQSCETIESVVNFEEHYRKYDPDERKDSEFPRKNSENPLQIVCPNPVLDRKINTHLLWENRTLVTNLLTKNFTLNCPHPNNHSQKSLLDEDIVTEIKKLFKNICQDESVGRNSVENVPIQNLKSIDCLMYFLDTLFEKDCKSVKYSFQDLKNENIGKILDELWYIHISLDRNKKNSIICSKDIYLTNKSNENKNSNSFCSHVKTSLKLYKKPMFVLISLCRSAHFLTFSPVITTAVDFALDKGLPEEDGKYVIGALALGDLFGRSFLGWITDKGYVTLPKYMMFGMIIQGAFTISLAFMDSRITFLSNIAMFALLQGSVFVRHPVLISRYMESGEQSIAMGCLNFFSGLLAIVLPSYIGYFRDIKGSYDGILFINGSIGALIGLLWIFEPYFVKASKSRNEKKNCFQATL